MWLNCKLQNLILVISICYQWQTCLQRRNFFRLVLLVDECILRNLPILGLEKCCWVWSEKGLKVTGQMVLGVLLLWKYSLYFLWKYEIVSWFRLYSFGCFITLWYWPLLLGIPLGYLEMLFVICQRGSSTDLFCLIDPLVFFCPSITSKGPSKLVSCRWIYCLCLNITQINKLVLRD